jgi:hypothetical protein
VAGLLPPRLTYAKVTTALAVALAAVSGAAFAAGGNADKVNGIDFKKFEFRTEANAAEQQILKAGDLRMFASCTGGTLDLEVRTLQNNAAYYADGNDEVASLPDFDSGEPHSVDSGAFGGEVDVVYQPRRGRRVGLQFFASDSDGLGGTTECLVTGFAFAGNGTSSGTGSASSVDGVSFARFDWAEDADSPPKTILSAGHLDVNAACSETGIIDLPFITRQDEAAIYSDGSYGLVVDSYDEGNPETLGPSGEEDVVYEPLTGPTVASQLVVAQGAQLPDPIDCTAAGIAFFK